MSQPRCARNGSDGRLDDGIANAPRSRRAARLFIPPPRRGDANADPAPDDARDRNEDRKLGFRKEFGLCLAKTTFADQALRDEAARPDHLRTPSAKPAPAPARAWAYSRFTVTVPFRINLPVASWPEAPVVAVSVTSVNSRSTLVADSAVIFTVPENEL